MPEILCTSSPYYPQITENYDSEDAEMGQGMINDTNYSFSRAPREMIRGTDRARNYNYETILESDDKDSWSNARCTHCPPKQQRKERDAGKSEREGVSYTESRSLQHVQHAHAVYQLV